MHRHAPPTIPRLSTVALFALLLAGPAGAQTVQKCVDRAGHARYQSDPCARGERIEEVWAAIPDPEPLPEAVAPPRRRRATAASPRSRRRAVYDVASNVGPDACARARAYRDAAEKRAGLARNYDFLSALDRRVFDACR